MLTVRLSDKQDGYEVLFDEGLEAFVSMEELLTFVDPATADNPAYLMRETIERVRRVARVRRFVANLAAGERGE